MEFGETSDVRLEGLVSSEEAVWSDDEIDPVDEYLGDSNRLLELVIAGASGIVVCSFEEENMEPDVVLVRAFMLDEDSLVDVMLLATFKRILRLFFRSQSYRIHGDEN